MSVLDALRAKGHHVELDGARVVLVVAAGADVAKAEQWARQREAELRAELVTEAHAVVGMVRAAYQGGRVREVRGPDGRPVRGQVEVRGG